MGENIYYFRGQADLHENIGVAYRNANFTHENHCFRVE